MGYSSDRKWADQYIPRAKQLIGPFLLDVADLQRDAREATDLIIMTAKDLRIACRFRRESYFKNYGGQFTIRLARTNGMQTEFDKILRGFGDMMFYGFASDRCFDFVEWYLIDLNAFRYHYSQDGWRERNRHLSWDAIQNSDDATSFAWFDIKSFPPDPPLLIGSGTAPHLYELEAS